MAKGWAQTWSNTAWWIVAIYSVPFALYTLPFIYGDFEIYKHFSIAAFQGSMDKAGLNIRDNLRSWQIHALAALLFVAIGPFQFNARFRNKHLVAHRRLGYTFAACTVVTAVSGATTMRNATDLGPIPVALTPFMSIGAVAALAVSVSAARNKRFQSHRRWMMRSAAIGYSVMYTRGLPVLIKLVFPGLSDAESLDYSFPLSLALNSGLAELYIRMYLTQPDHTPKGAVAERSALCTDKKDSFSPQCVSNLHTIPVIDTKDTAIDENMPSLTSVEHSVRNDAIGVFIARELHGAAQQE